MSARQATIDIDRERFAGSEIPGEVEFILSALEAGVHGKLDKRRAGRVPYRVKGLLRLYSDAIGSEPWVLYTRDVSPRSLGFITPHRLPLGYGGVVELVTKDGQLVEYDCTLLRCREAAPGWFEGALYFNRRQWQFAPEELA